MVLSSIWKICRDDMRWFGILHAIADLSYRFLRRAVFIRWLRGMALTEINTTGIDLPSGLEARFVRPDELIPFSDPTRYDLTPEFLKDVGIRGDQCLAIFDGEKLANYSWYSRQPVYWNYGLWIHFGAPFVYVYKCFTEREYRGKKLNVVGTAIAAEHFLKRGALGMVLHVECNNFGSLRSFSNGGYRFIGEILALSWFGKSIVLNKKRNLAFGVRAERHPDVPGGVEKSGLPQSTPAEMEDNILQMSCHDCAVETGGKDGIHEAMPNNISQNCGSFRA